MTDHDLRLLLRNAATEHAGESLSVNDVLRLVQEHPRVVLRALDPKAVLRWLRERATAE